MSRFDHRRLYNAILEEMAAARPVKAAMHRLVRECRDQRPSDDWVPFLGLPYDELDSLVSWLRAPFVEEAPEEPLSALWFGLFNPLQDDGTPSSDLYMAGSTSFEADSSDPWPGGFHWPSNRHDAASSVLEGIYRLAHSEGGPGEVAEYSLCLGYGVLAVNAVIRDPPSTLLLGESESLYLEVGFDSGDSVRLGRLSPSSLVRV